LNGAGAAGGAPFVIGAVWLALLLLLLPPPPPPPPLDEGKRA
jgi:hypothetical protein